MLNVFRKNTKLIVWTVILAFALWGGFSVGTQFKQDGRYAGQVFGKKISFQEYDRFYRATQIFAAPESDKDVDPEMLRQSAWQAVIFSREAKQRQIEVSDSEVREQVLNLLNQQKVDPQNYEDWVQRSLRQPPKQFEEQIREVLRIQKLFAQFTPAEDSLKITPEEAEKVFLDEKNQVSSEFVRFATKNEADLFRENLKTPEDWKTEKNKKPEVFKATGLLPAAALPAILQLNPADSLSLQALEKNHFSEVIPIGNEFGIFYIADITVGDKKEFESSKDQYMATLQERKKQQALMEKANEILQRAQLTDYLKAAEASAAR